MGAFKLKIVHPKMNILSSFTHPCVVPNYDFCEIQRKISIQWKSMGSNLLSGSQCSFYFNTYRFGMTWEVFFHFWSSYTFDLYCIHDLSVSSVVLHPLSYTNINIFIYEILQTVDNSLSKFLDHDFGSSIHFPLFLFIAVAVSRLIAILHMVCS